MEIIYRLPAMPGSSRRRGAERSGALAALGSERRAGPGPARPSAGGGAAEKPLSAGAGVWAERRGSSAGPRKAAGPPRRGVPEAGRGSPERNPPREGSEGCGREGGGGARPTRPQLAARRCDANWRPFRRCPRSGLSELSASARGETGVCLFRSGRKKSQANQWACRCRAEPACFFRPRNGERYGSRKALPLRFPLRTSSPRPAAAERPAGPESRRAGAERGRCGSRERRFGGAGGQWLSTAVPVLRARGSGASAGN